MMWYTVHLIDLYLLPLDEQLYLVGLVSFFVFFCVCNLCYLYSLVKMHCGVFGVPSVL